jgi:hypothetical protein
MRQELKRMKYKNFIEFCKDGDRTIKEITEHFDMKEATVYSRLRRLNLSYSKLCKHDIVRNETILKLVKQDELTYQEIGDIFGITKQRVKGIVYKSGYSRWAIRKVKYEVIGKDVKNDLKLGLTYPEIRDKYGIKTLDRLVYNKLIPRLYTKSINKRNDEITKRYKKQRAIDIVKSKDIDVNNPNGVQQEKSVYSIASNNGYRKYPKIGRRCDGGTFEDKKILRYISKKRDKDKWTFKRISDKLNSLGHKTLTGKEFTIPNVIYKYNAHKKKNKYKRLKY